MPADLGLVDHVGGNTTRGQCRRRPRVRKTSYELRVELETETVIPVKTKYHKNIYFEASENRSFGCVVSCEPVGESELHNVSGNTTRGQCRRRPRVRKTSYELRVELETETVIPVKNKVPEKYILRSIRKQKFRVCGFLQACE